MSRHRFFVTEPLGERNASFSLPLSPADLHHAVRVLRLQPGELVVLVEPGVRSHLVRLDAVGPDSLMGRTVDAVLQQAEPHITLVQGLVKGDGMDEIVRHAVELGAERIVPLVTERTVVRLDAAKVDARVSRWQRIAESAARQSQRSRIPVVERPLSVEAFAATLSEAGACGTDRCIVLWEDSLGESLSSVLERLLSDGGRRNRRAADANVALVIGPEGGLTAAEVPRLSAAGAQVASLGAAVLRAETAALAAMTLAADALGAL